MNPRARLPEFSLLRKRRPGLEEIETLLDLLPQAALLYDIRDDRILLANARTTELTAYTRQEIGDLTLAELLPGLDPEKISRWLENGQAPAESSLQRRKGKRIPALLRLASLGQDGQWALITLESASRVRQKETELELESQRWEALHILALAPQHPNLQAAYLKILQAGQLLTGASLLALYLPGDRNATLRPASVWGEPKNLPNLPQSEASHLRVPTIWSPGKRGENALYRFALGGNFSYMASAPVDQTRPLDGLLIVADQTAGPTENLPTYLEILTGTIATTTQYHSLSSKLHEKQKTYSHYMAQTDAIKDVIHDGIIFTTPDLQVLDLNASAESILGYTLDEAQGEPLEKLLIGAKPLAPALNAVRESTTVHNLGDVKLHRRDGQAILANLRAAPVVVDGRVERIAVMVSDLSANEEIRLRSQKLEQQAVLGEVTAIFAHEVRNPINNISTGLQVMAMNLPKDDPLHAQIERMHQDCDRLTHLMKSVLALSGPREYKMEAIDLGMLLQRLLDRWRPRMGRLNIQQRLQIAPDAPQVRGDFLGIEQVFTNLISNAIQAMSGQGGVLAVRIDSPEDPGNPAMVAVTVSDTGPGIPEELREKIFTPFFTTNKDGTGLGLAITQRIVNAHRGSINVNSFPGGTVFEVKLPVSQPHDSATPMSDSS